MNQNLNLEFDFGSKADVAYTMDHVFEPWPWSDIMLQKLL